jgi:hypothetical protein
MYIVYLQKESADTAMFLSNDQPKEKLQVEQKVVTVAGVNMSIVCK